MQTTLDTRRTPRYVAMFTVCVAAALPHVSYADDVCAHGGALDAALRSSERVHSRPRALGARTLVLPVDVGTLPRSAVFVRLPRAEPLDVFVHRTTGSEGLVAYDRSGAMKWRRALRGPHVVTACGRTVYVVDGRRLEALEHDTGAVRWSQTIEGEVVRLGAIGCDLLLARRGDAATSTFADVVHVLGARDGRARVEVPCTGCLPRSVSRETFVWTSPVGVHVLDADADDVTLYALRLPDDDAIKGRAGNTLIVFREGELSGIDLDGTVRFRRRGRVRVLLVGETYVLVATSTALEVLDTTTGALRHRIETEGALRVGLEDARAFAIDDTRALVRMSEPLALEAVVDVASGHVDAQRALPFAIETTLVRDGFVLHAGNELLLCDPLAQTPPLRATITAEAERAALADAISRLAEEDPFDFVPALAGHGRCAFEERPAMRLSLLETVPHADDASFSHALVHAIVSEVRDEGSGARLLGHALSRIAPNASPPTYIALGGWLARDDALLDDDVFDAWLSVTSRMLEGAGVADARATLETPTCRTTPTNVTCARADAALDFARQAYVLGARTHATHSAFSAIEESIARLAAAPLRGTTRTGAILRAAARGRFAFDPPPESRPLVSDVGFDFPTVFGVREATPTATSACGITFAEPRMASSIERGDLRAAAYAVRIHDRCTGEATTMLVSSREADFVPRGFASAPPVTH